MNVGGFHIIWSLKVFETNESTAEDIFSGHQVLALLTACLLYTSDAADE